MNVEHEKLNVVRHDEYIPREYLPTFSSHPIELNLHRIESLNEKFVLFNDDMFIINRTTETDFFKNDLPVDEAVLYPITASNGIFQHILLNDAQFFSRYFDIRNVIKNNPLKWFNKAYGKSLLKTMSMVMFPELSGIMLHHQAQSYLKSTLKEVWEKNQEELNRTCQHKFRNVEDVNQYIFRYWQLGNGRFIPSNLLKRGKYFDLGANNLDITKVINESSYKLVCLNDGSVNTDFEKTKEMVKKAFEKKFPEKCSYEI